MTEQQQARHVARRIEEIKAYLAAMQVLEELVRRGGAESGELPP